MAKKASKTKAPRKPASKSQEKRLAAQTQAKTSVQTVDSQAVTNEILTRLARLETNQSLLREAFQFAANELRPLFGFGPIALIFDEIAKKLQK